MQLEELQKIVEKSVRNYEEFQKRIDEEELHS